MELKQGEIEKLQAEYESLSAKHMESEFGIAALRTEYDGLKSAHDTLALSLEAKQADIEALTAESLERLEAQKKRAEAAEAAISEAREKSAAALAGMNRVKQIKVKHISSQELDDLFRKHDSDNSGDIDPEEMKAFVEDLCGIMERQMEKDREECEEAKAALALSVELKQGEIEKLRAEFDKSAHDALVLSLQNKDVEIELLTAKLYDSLEQVSDVPEQLENANLSFQILKAQSDEIIQHEREKVLDLDQRVKDEQLKVAALHAELSSAKEALKNSKSQISILEVRLEEMKTAQMEGQSCSPKVLESAQLELIGAHSDIIHLKDALMKADLACHAYSAEVEHLKTALASSQATFPPDIAGMQNFISGLQEQAKKDSALIKGLQTSEGAASARCKEAEAKLAELEVRMLSFVAEEARWMEEIEDRENREQKLLKALEASGVVVEVRDGHVD